MITSEQPKIHVLKRRLEHFLRNLLLRFVKPSAMLYKPVLDVQFEVPAHVKKDEDVLIGQPAMDFITGSKSLRDERKQEFFAAVKSFYKVAVKYLKDKLPFADKVLHHATVADPNQQESSSFASVKFFLDRWPCLLPPGSTVSDVQFEFSQYQCTDISGCVEKDVGADVIWGRINKLSEDGEDLFKVLPRVMASILCIPHSSAHCERIFSVVRKNQTEFRSRLGHETLQALVVAKTRHGDALSREYADKDLDDFKSAYYASLKAARTN